jgi:hypothetical protein
MNDFHAEEYGALRKEIEIKLQEFSTLRRFSIIGVALAYAWLASQELDGMPIKAVAWLSPVIIPACGMLISRATSKHVDEIGKYIQKIENDSTPENKEATGWENYRERHGSSASSRADCIFWWTFLGLSVLTSIAGLLAA